MDALDWVTEGAKVGAGAVAGVFAGTRKMEARVRALEERAKVQDAHAEVQDQTLAQLHATVSADHDVIVSMNTKLDLIMDAMQLRART